MNPAVVMVAVGGWYPAGAARAIATLDQHSPHIPTVAWVNTLPCGAAEVPYGYKPAAMRAALGMGHDIVLWLDASYYAVRPIDPLIEHIASTGYYFCENGFNVGEWCKDQALGPLQISRDESFGIPEVSGSAIGLNFNDDRCVRLLNEWEKLAQDRVTFPGPHTNGSSGRNPGWCSDDPRVRGHRHDQTAISVLAWRMGMHQRIHRPRFTAYANGMPIHDETLLVNHGGVR